MAEIVVKNDPTGALVASIRRGATWCRCRKSRCADRCHRRRRRLGQRRLSPPAQPRRNTGERRSSRGAQAAGTQAIRHCAAAPRSRVPRCRTTFKRSGSASRCVSHQTCATPKLPTCVKEGPMGTRAKANTNRISRVAPSCHRPDDTHSLLTGRGGREALEARHGLTGRAAPAFVLYGRAGRR